MRQILFRILVFAFLSESLYSGTSHVVTIGVDYGSGTVRAVYVYDDVGGRSAIAVYGDVNFTYDGGFIPGIQEEGFDVRWRVGGVIADLVESERGVATVNTVGGVGTFCVFGDFPSSGGGTNYAEHNNNVFWNYAGVVGFNVALFNVTVVVPDNLAEAGYLVSGGEGLDESLAVELYRVFGSLLLYQNRRLDDLLILGSLIFGSLLFIHFGRFMRW